MSDLQFKVEQQQGAIAFNCEGLKEQLAAKADEYIQKYSQQAFTEDDKKEAKKDLADLRRFKKRVNERKIEVMNVHMMPYRAFEAEVKSLIAIIDGTITSIDSQVKEIEDRRVKERKAAICEIYEEIVPEELQDYIPLECIYSDKWTNATTTIKSVRQELEGHVQRTRTDILAIRSMGSEAEGRALSLYMADRSLAAAMKLMSDYEKQKAEILRRQEEENARRLERERQAEIERARREERERILEEQRAEQERQEALRRAEEERAAAIEKEREEAVQEAIASMIPDMDAAVELYEYGIYLSPDAKEKLEIYMDSVGIEWEAR